MGLGKTIQMLTRIVEGKPTAEDLQVSKWKYGKGTLCVSEYLYCRHVPFFHIMLKNLDTQQNYHTTGRHEAMARGDRKDDGGSRCCTALWDETNNQ